MDIDKFIEENKGMTFMVHHDKNVSKIFRWKHFLTDESATVMTSEEAVAIFDRVIKTVKEKTKLENMYAYFRMCPNGGLELLYATEITDELREQIESGKPLYDYKPYLPKEDKS